MATKPFAVPNSILITPTGATEVVEIVRGATSQSADIVQWQNSGGTVLARVGSDGSLSGVNGTFSGDIAVNGGDITSSATTFNLLNSTVTTLNIGGAATAVSIGNSAGTVTIPGNLTVNGTTTTINSTIVSVDDKLLELGSVTSPDNTTADGGGISLKGTTDKTFTWVSSNTAWTSSENLDLVTSKTYKIAGTDVLSATTLGAGVTQSSLTKLGTISTGVWQATSIGTAYTDAKIVSVSAAGSGLSASTTAGAVTVTSNATHLNTANTIVSRDNLGNFTAGTITANLTGTATSVSNSLTAASGLSASATFNGSAAVNIGLATVTQGTNGANFVKVTLDSYGRVSATGAVASGDIISALGYTPANSSSTITGTGASNKIAFWSGTSTLTNDTELGYDSTNDVLQVAHANVKGSTTEVTVGTTTTDIDSFATSTYRSAKYLVQTRNSGSTIFQVSEALVIHDGTNAYVTEYGQIYTSGTAPLINLSATIVTGNVKLQGIGAAAGNVVRFTRISMNS